MERSQVRHLVHSFMAETVKHPLQEQAHEAVSFACHDNPSASIVVLAGPTGVGKSTILAKFADEFLLQQAEALEADRCLRPIVYSAAVASGHRGFDWKRLFRDAAASLDDPFARSLNRRGHQRAAPATRRKNEPIGASLLREELEAELKLRGTRIWIIDEAQHVIRGGRTGGPGDQLDVLKSLAQTSTAKVLLCGTYDLPDYMVGSGQLSRRSSVVRFNRYRWTDAAERRVFASVVNAILRRLPERSSYPDVKEHLQFFYVYSVGCVGIFKEWAARAMAKQLTLGDAALTIDHFRETSLSARELAVINQEVIDGESRYGDGSDEVDEALKRSILRGTAMPSRRVRSQFEGSVSSQTLRASRVGERVPGRDRVGDAS